jgi:hypothetical protein
MWIPVFLGAITGELAISSPLLFTAEQFCLGPKQRSAKRNELRSYEKLMRFN